MRSSDKVGKHGKARPRRRIFTFKRRLDVSVCNGVATAFFRTRTAGLNRLMNELRLSGFRCHLTFTPAPQDITMKLILLLALHRGAHASLRHKATKNAVDAETTQSLVEAAKAGVVKMPGAVAKLFGREEGAEVPAKQAQGPVEQHQDKFKAGSAPDKVDIYYLGVEGPPADFILVDTKSGAEHRIPIEAGTHITYDNSVYEHRVDAHPDSKRTLLGPASLPSGGRRLEAVGGAPQWFIDGYCPENIQ